MGTTGHIILKLYPANFCPLFFAGKSVPLISGLKHKDQAWEVNLSLKSQLAGVSIRPYFKN